MVELPNPGEEGYKTAHLQKKDETYADIVVLADIFTESHILPEKSVPKEGAIYPK